ncbi:hypothetical protein ACFLQ2_04220 [archaeon]
MKLDWPLVVGIIAMVLLVAGTVSEGGSVIQKVLFVIGAPALGVTAYANKQKMFTALQSVATVGAVLAFFPVVPGVLRYVTLVGAGLLGVAYLFKTGYYKEDKFGWIGTIGLLCIAAGFATNATLHLLWFSLFLGVGGLVVAAYSALNFFHYKIKIALIWVVLNVLFSVGPILNLVK